MPKLIVAFSAANQIPHELTDDHITIGRAAENIVQIDDVSVSGRHAELRLIGDDYHLRDLGSTNGTRVNGTPVTERIVRRGDRLRFGAIETRFENEAAGPMQPLPVASVAEAQPATLSARPTGFENASPFPHRDKARDPNRTLVLAAAGLALLAFLGSMLALLRMHAPMP